MDAALFSPFASPVILFFILGMIAAFLRSDLAIPEALAKSMSIYLMVAIGLKGGVAVAQSGFDAQILVALAMGVTFSLTIPLLAFAALRSFGRLDALNAGAVAAHYGSVSVVTFVTGVEILTSRGMAPQGYMVAVLAVMETPAILTGLLLARRAARKFQIAPQGDLMREVFLNGSVVLLLGGFATGMIAGPSGYAEVKPLFDHGFKGVLCLFLLDLGLIAARRLRENRSVTWRLMVLAIAMPLVNGSLGILAASMAGLDVGSVAAFGILCASASYIAVPAAMRMALPEADPGTYLTMSLSITFPFNVLFGIGLFAALAQMLALQ